jgi:hypothetical protein
MSITLQMLTRMRTSAADHLTEETGLTEDELHAKLSKINGALYVALAETANEVGLTVELTETGIDEETGTMGYRIAGLGPAILGFLSVNEVGNHISSNIGYMMFEQKLLAERGEGGEGHPLAGLLGMLGGMDDDLDDDDELDL